MAKYRIPEHFKPAFELIKNLSKKESKLIQDILDKAPIGSTPEDIVSSLDKKSSLKHSDLVNMFYAIYNLINLNQIKEGSFERFLDDLTLSYKTSNPDLKENDEKKLRNNLKNFLKSEGKVKYTIKAATLIQENDKIFKDSKIISDIRIVFEDNLENAKQNAVLVHQLKIIYEQNLNIKNFFVSLDSNDLIQLRETINRAIKKDELIEKNTYKEISFIQSKKRN